MAGVSQEPGNSQDHRRSQTQEKMEARRLLVSVPPEGCSYGHIGKRSHSRKMQDTTREARGSATAVGQTASFGVHLETLETKARDDQIIFLQKVVSTLREAFLCQPNLGLLGSTSPVTELQSHPRAETQVRPTTRNWKGHNPYLNHHNDDNARNRQIVMVVIIVER